MPKNIAAQIFLPRELFLTNYNYLISQTYCVEVDHSKFTEFSLFAKSIIHEISHLKLFLDGITGLTAKTEKAPYWQEEKAVDTLAILYGFAEIYAEASSYFNYDRDSEYVNNQEVLFLYSCWKEKRKFKKIKKSRLKRLLAKFRF